MSDPTPLKPQPHHGKRAWTTYWRTNRRACSKRFGIVGQVSKAEAQAKFKQWLDTEYAALVKAGAPVYSVPDLCRDYLVVVKKRYIQPDGKHSTSLDRHRLTLESFGQRYTHHEASSITPADVHAWLESYISAPHARRGSMQPAAPRKKNRTRHTVNLALSYLKRMYRWAAVMGKVTAATAGGVVLVETIRGDHPDARRKPAVVSVSEAALHSTCDRLTPALQDLLWFFWWTGCRPGEAARLTWAEIDKSRKTVWVYSPARHKTAWRGKSRHIAIGPRAQEILKRHIRKEMHLTIFRRPGSEGGAWTTHRIREDIRIACRAAGIDYWTTNQLRHAYATRVQSTHGAEAVQAVLGHSSIQQQNVYVDKTVTLAVKIAGEVG